MIKFREKQHSLTENYYRRLGDRKPVTMSQARIAEEETAGQLARIGKSLSGMSKENRQKFLNSHGERLERAGRNRMTAASLVRNFAGDENNMPKDTSKRIMARVKQIAKNK